MRHQAPPGGHGRARAGRPAGASAECGSVTRPGEHWSRFGRAVAARRGERSRRRNEPHGEHDRSSISAACTGSGRARAQRARTARCAFSMNSTPTIWAGGRSLVASTSRPRTVAAAAAPSVQRPARPPGGAPNRRRRTTSATAMVQRDTGSGGSGRRLGSARAAIATPQQVAARPRARTDQHVAERRRARARSRRLVLRQRPAPAAGPGRPSAERCRAPGREEQRHHQRDDEGDQQAVIARLPPATPTTHQRRRRRRPATPAR